MFSVEGGVLVDINKDTTLLEALNLAQDGDGIFSVLNEMISNTGLSKEEISKIMEPYSEAILSSNGLSEQDIKKLASEILAKVK